MNECQIKADCLNMLGQGKRVKLSTHFTDWMKMLGLRDEVNEQTALQIYTVVTT